ncbi:hypothetical protein C491_14472 [Natronococcus amylolyticus DSM 10524]|uniref:Uncharacterized protein n=1 Tax=Natronococcus amylolyticus DSM 10524 TaxID=1227497 RepID=L9X360_9EURY|nr:hypothetical protein C491_14472 [Natronococcus amylolyticus DSM 10524]
MVPPRGRDGRVRRERAVSGIRRSVRATVRYSTGDRENRTDGEATAADALECRGDDDDLASERLVRPVRL